MEPGWAPLCIHIHTAFEAICFQLGLTSSGFPRDAAAQELSFLKKSSEKELAAKLLCSSMKGIFTITGPEYYYKSDFNETGDKLRQYRELFPVGTFKICELSYSD